MHPDTQPRLTQSSSRFWHVFAHSIPASLALSHSKRCSGGGQESERRPTDGVMVPDHVIGLKDLSVMVAGAVLWRHTLARVTEKQSSGAETAFLTHTVTTSVRQRQRAARLVTHTATHLIHLRIRTAARIRVLHLHIITVCVHLPRVAECLHARLHQPAHC